MVAKTKWNTTRGGNQFSKPRGGRLEQMISWMSLSGEMKVTRREFSNADFWWCHCHHPRVRHWPGEAEAHFHSKLMTTRNIDLFKNICWRAGETVSDMLTLVLECDPQCPHKNLGMVRHVCNPSGGEVETGDSLGLLHQSSSFYLLTLSKKVRWMAVEYVCPSMISGLYRICLMNKWFNSNETYFFFKKKK